jgi:hypothetical protein
LSDELKTASDRRLDQPTQPAKGKLSRSAEFRIAAGIALVVLAQLCALIDALGPIIGEQSYPRMHHEPLKEMAISCSTPTDYHEDSTVSVTVNNENKTDVFQFTFYLIDGVYREPYEACNATRRIDAGETASVSCEIAASDLGNDSRKVWVWAMASDDEYYVGSYPNSYQARCRIPEPNEASNMILALGLPILTCAAGLGLLIWEIRFRKLADN